jgi:hypothetical protein
MEDVLSQLDAGSLDIKLTSEKLFINTPTSNEAFALRSVNGIGVIDLLDEYNNLLTYCKESKIKAIIGVCFGAFLAVVGAILIVTQIQSDKGIIPELIFTGIGLLITLPGIAYLNKPVQPKLMSAVRIMMSGGNRDFKFDKTGVKSGNVAEFVAKVESTLTAYHKNHD